MKIQIQVNFIFQNKIVIKNKKKIKRLKIKNLNLKYKKQSKKVK